MNNLQEFNFKGNNVRTVQINNEPYFVGKDVTEILGYTNSRDAISKHVDEEDKKVLKSQNATLENMPNRGLISINESGLYSLILSSKLPTAKEFKRWVTSEVLPSIRKHGAYMTDQQAVTSSLQVAETFNKNHQHILEAIDDLTVENPTVKKMFVEGTDYYKSTSSTVVNNGAVRELDDYVITITASSHKFTFNC